MSEVGGNTGPPRAAQSAVRWRGRAKGAPPDPATLGKTTLPGAPRLHPRPPFTALRDPEVFKALTPAPVQRSLP